MIKKTAFILLAMATVAVAGEQMVDSKYVTPVEPEPVYGVGPYVALYGGINAYQNYDGTQRFSIGDTTYAVERKEKIGGFGGLKAGYVFNDGPVRPAVELDAFYNGVDSDIELRANGRRIADLSERYDTGAFLGNFILRFDLGMFQPYVGAGAGIYVGQADDIRFTVPGVGSVSRGSSDTEVGFAWQVLAGSDIFFTENVSLFFEYKWLNYEDANVFGAGDRIGQHLVGAGVRFFF